MAAFDVYQGSLVLCFGGVKMSKECVWYDGVEGCYHLLAFDPNGLRNWQVVEKARKQLEDCFGLYGKDVDRATEAVYLMDVDSLEKLKENG